MIAAAMAGAPVSMELVDAGPVVRWGLPIVDAIGDVVGAVTIACLVLALVVLPRRVEPSAPEADQGHAGVSRFHPAYERALDIGMGLGMVWSTLLVLRLVLGYALAAGQAPFSPRFGSDLLMYITRLELGQYQLAGAVFVAAASTMLIVVRSRTGLLIALSLVFAALVTKSMTGHASGQTSHEAATSAMIVHLVAAGVWLGGLALLVLIAGRLGARLGDAAERFSVLALACYGALAASGIASALVRLSAPLDLVTTAYGWMLVLKTMLLVLLGGAGWWQRRRVLVRLRDSDRRRDFLWLAAGEVFLIAAATGIAAALSNTAPPVPDEPEPVASTAEALTDYPLPAPPELTTLLTTWRVDVAGMALALGLAVIYLWVRVLRPVTGRGGRRWPVGRTSAWVAGCAVIVWVTSGAPGVYAPVQFSVHLGQHALLALVAVPLLVAGRFGDLVRERIAPRSDGSAGLRELVDWKPRSRAGQWIVHPVVLALLGAVGFAAIYLTPALGAGLQTAPGRLIVLAAAVVAGAAVALPIQGRALGGGTVARAERWVALAVGTGVLAGVALLFALALPVVEPDWFAVMGRTWGADALGDQRLGGWVLLALVLVLAVLHGAVISRSRRSSEGLTVRRSASARH
ncbi:cytochrome c oxidase assembly protein [Brachybacterium alimentarium]|uniref:cytochrome c oxidase assembly protein n=1 Tax=Brachybacterium alimentarium TaxID=47845 RepID=UPI003FD32605